MFEPSLDLNESRTAAFYLLKVEAIRIGNSNPAALLTLITGPSEETRVVGDQKAELVERHIEPKEILDGASRSCEKQN